MDGHRVLGFYGTSTEAHELNQINLFLSRMRKKMSTQLSIIYVVVVVFFFGVI